MKKPQLYWLAWPWTWKKGPGHKLHLTRDTKKTRTKKALCQVEKNALRMEGVHWQKEALSLEEIQDLTHFSVQLDPKDWRVRVEARKLCRNCMTMAERGERDANQ